MPFLSGFTKRKAIKYGTVFPGSNLTDFPVLITIAGDSDIASELSGGGGIDVTSSDGTTQIPFGLYPSSVLASGDLILRFKASPLTGASTGDVMAYIYFKSSHSTVEDKSAVVSNNYALFMPLEEDPSGSAPQMYDWVTESNIGTSNGSMTSGDLVTGTVGKALDFDGSNDYIDCGEVTSLNGSGEATLRVIMTTTDTSSIQAIGRGNFAGDALSILHNTDGNIYIATSDGFKAQTRSSLPNSGVGTHAYTMVFDGAAAAGSRISGFANGVALTLGGASSNPASTVSTTADHFRIGAFGENGDKAVGAQDEVSISLVARSVHWDLYQYENEFNNSDTLTLGTLETGGASTVYHNFCLLGVGG